MKKRYYVLGTLAKWAYNKMKTSKENAQALDKENKHGDNNSATREEGGAA